MEDTGLKSVGVHKRSAWCWMGVVDPPLLSSLGKDYSINLPLLGLQRICPDRSPINDRKPLHSSAIPSWGPEQPTVRHKPPGRQASLGLALTALLMRHPDRKAGKQGFTNLLPVESSAPTLLCDFTMKSLALQTFCLFWPPTQKVIHCFHCEGGPADRIFSTSDPASESSLLIERTVVHFLN